MVASSVPTNVQAYNSYRSVVLSWDNPADIGTYPVSGYQVRIKLASASVWGTPVDKTVHQHSHTFAVAAGVYDPQTLSLIHI